MRNADIPRKFPIPFAGNAGAPYINEIPVASQIGLQPGRASLNDGFVPANMQPIAVGGIPPYGQDMNGILFQTTAWCRWIAAGCPVYFDSDFSVSVNGYPGGAVLLSRLVIGKQWISLADDNTTNPDAFGPNWIEMPGTWSTGQVRGHPIPNDVPIGWVPMLPGYTIGAPGSAATFADASAVFLYVKLWNKFGNPQCPVTGGRGPNALSDFNNLKPLQIYEGAGNGMIGNDAGTGRLTGVPAITGAITNTGSVVGEALHAMTLDQNGPHNHVATVGTESALHTHTAVSSTGGMSAGNPHTHSTAAYTPAGGGAGVTTGGVAQPISYQGFNVSTVDINHGHDISLTTATEGATHNHAVGIGSSGSGTPHNVTHRSMVVDWLQKL